MPHPLAAPLATLVRDYEALRPACAAFVLATVVATEGSTYRKAGAQMLITDRSELRGLLSGGCLEVDLVEHARDVLAGGGAKLVSYDMRSGDDALFGIGSGCEGAMRVLLQRVGPAERWQPLAAIADCRAEGRPAAIALLVDGPVAGRGWWDGGGDAPGAEPDAVREARRAAARDGATREIDSVLDGARATVLVLALSMPPRLLVCGAGLDAEPLARHAVALGFDVTVCDHRPALAAPARFPHCRLRCQPPGEFARIPELAGADAAVVMSHHLAADRAYLEAIAAAPHVGYVGLLGPPPRRERLLRELGTRREALAGRLRAPVGLDIGARTPEAIALAIAAELHAWIASGRGRRPGGAGHS